MLRGTSEYIKIHFEGGLGLTKLNPVPSIFIFPQHLRRKPSKSRTDPEEWCRKQWKETPQTSRSKKVLISRTKDFNRLERRIFCFWRSLYSLLAVRVRWCRGPNWFNSLRNRSKLNGEFVSFYRQIQKFFATLISDTDCKYFLNSGTFILTKLGSIVLKL